ncbi:MAG TPA: phage portal protein [Phycisphaerales bacterium]|nr:phage portal protein [Phycisphaerales bacterium]
MGYRLQPLASSGLTQGLLDALLEQHERVAVPRLARLWAYYRNQLDPLAAGETERGGRWYRVGQEQGLPARIAGTAGGTARPGEGGGGEVVVENDIAWRVHTMVDFMFGRPVRLVSTAKDPGVRAGIERALEAVWEISGGIGLLQDMALLGHVYGHVDLLVRALGPVSGSPGRGSGRAGGAGGRVGRGWSAEEVEEIAAEAAQALRVEVIEPTRGLALLSPGDFRQIDAYVVRVRRESKSVSLEGAGAAGPPGAGLARALRLGGPGRAARRRLETVTEVFAPGHRQLYIDAGSGPRLVESEPNTLCPGHVPVAHIQNLSQPFQYEGLGEVEPLIPLQDELNARLSDRASRVTLQSFKMYLARGIEGFGQGAVGPGQVWSTDNPEASIESIGGDAASPSEERHIEEVREALDKASGVPPLATGVVRAKVGNLTSENALRITLTGLLSKTARKRIGYGRGMAQACRIILTALDEAGLLPTDPSERGVTVQWPDPLPRGEQEVLREALLKRELGVPVARLLEELGYGPGEPGVV